MNRRQFLGNAIAATAVSDMAVSKVSKLWAQPVSPWGNPVLDIHFHTRQTPEADFAHLDGAGVAIAVLFTPAPEEMERSNEAIAKYLGRFYLFTSVDVTRPDAIEILKKTVVAGTKGFGELGNSGFFHQQQAVNILTDSPEMQRVYDLAAEVQMPVLMHMQDYSFPNSSLRAPLQPQFARLEAMLKAHPKTIFIGHGPSFWANISADVPPAAYPTGPIKPGGLSDKMLSDYPNLYGDLSANSGRSALARDTEFATAFLARHQDKLMFGSDCPCADGRGAGQSSRDPAINGKCLARVQLTQLKQLTPPDRFRKITWENGTKLLRLDVAV